MNTPIDNRLVDSYINQQIKFKNEEIRKKAFMSTSRMIEFAKSL